MTAPRDEAALREEVRRLAVENEALRAAIAQVPGAEALLPETLRPPKRSPRRSLGRGISAVLLVLLIALGMWYAYRAGSEAARGLRDGFDATSKGP